MRPRTSNKCGRDGELGFRTPARSFAIVLLCLLAVMAVKAESGEALPACSQLGYRLRHHVSDRFDPSAAGQANRRGGLPQPPGVLAL